MAQQAGESTEDIEEEHHAWQVNSFLLYGYQKSYGLEWPSLTSQWLPGVYEKGDDAEYCIQNLILGTHAVENEPNYLLIAEVTLPLPDTVIDLRTTNEDGETNVTAPEAPSIHYKTRIRHEGEVNRARYMPQNPVSKVEVNELICFHDICIICYDFSVLCVSFLILAISFLVPNNNISPPQKNRIL